MRLLLTQDSECLAGRFAGLMDGSNNKSLKPKLLTFCLVSILFGGPPNFILNQVTEPIQTVIVATQNRVLL